MSEHRDGAQRIAAERARQKGAEGWSDEHDSAHDNGELAWAAVCYAAPKAVYVERRGQDLVTFADPWPWEPSDDKRVRPYGTLKEPTEQRIRQLEKAGALIAAEIDRLLRDAGHV
jgi:hypothetical protein